MKNIWFSKSISIGMKIRLFQASCISILLYGSETWILTQKLMNSIDSFATNCYRIMLGIKRIDHVTNKEVYNKVRQGKLSQKVAKRQLTWIGHMLRRDKDELIKIYGLYEPNQSLGRAKRGKLKENYISAIAGLRNKDIKMNAAEITRTAQDREKWKQFVVVCTEALT